MTKEIELKENEENKKNKKNDFDTKALEAVALFNKITDFKKNIDNSDVSDEIIAWTNKKDSIKNFKEKINKLSESIDRKEINEANKLDLVLALIYKSSFAKEQAAIENKNKDEIALFAGINHDSIWSNKVNLSLEYDKITNKTLENYKNKDYKTLADHIDNLRKNNLIFSNNISEVLGNKILKNEEDIELPDDGDLKIITDISNPETTGINALIVHAAECYKKLEVAKDKDQVALKAELDVHLQKILIKITEQKTDPRKNAAQRKFNILISAINQSAQQNGKSLTDYVSPETIDIDTDIDADKKLGLIKDTEVYETYLRKCMKNINNATEAKFFLSLNARIPLLKNPGDDLKDCKRKLVEFAKIELENMFLEFENDNVFNKQKWKAKIPDTDGKIIVTCGEGNENVIVVNVKDDGTQSYSCSSAKPTKAAILGLATMLYSRSGKGHYSIKGSDPDSVVTLLNNIVILHEKNNNTSNVRFKLENINRLLSKKKLSDKHFKALMGHLQRGRTAEQLREYITANVTNADAQKKALGAVAKLYKADKNELEDPIVDEELDLDEIEEDLNGEELDEDLIIDDELDLDKSNEDLKGKLDKIKGKKKMTFKIENGNNYDNGMLNLRDNKIKIEKKVAQENNEIIEFTDYKNFVEQYGEAKNDAERKDILKALTVKQTQEFIGKLSSEMLGDYLSSKDSGKLDELNAMLTRVRDVLNKKDAGQNNIDSCLQVKITQAHANLMADNGGASLKELYNELKNNHTKVGDNLIFSDTTVQHKVVTTSSQTNNQGLQDMIDILAVAPVSRVVAQNNGIG
ncbi:MAG: hypothetical protein COC15_02660 [Legionellales bacterium]|nr:MAG: hypothetical protein COC15_02660 [Legionellales bacterium]